MTAHAPNFCGHCGNAFNEQARFCEGCGAARPASLSAPTPEAMVQPKGTAPVAEGRKWFRREPIPLLFGVATFIAAYTVLSIPTDRVRMPIILAPLYYAVGPEVFFGFVSAALALLVWAITRFET